MAWEWLPQVVTGATGTAGVAFTYLASRSSTQARLKELLATHEFQRGAAIREERREVYADLLGVVDAFDRAVAKAGPVMEEWYAAHGPGGAERIDADLPPEARAVTDAFDDFDERFQNALLVSSERTTEALYRLRTAAHDAWKFLVDSDVKWHYLDPGVRIACIAEMRGDLGYGSGRPPEAAP